MTMQDIIDLLMQQPDKYAVDSYEWIPVGIKPARTHKKKRINKKWLKRYGVVTKYERKKCKKIDVTYQTIINFCYENGYPLPDEIRDMIS